MSWHGDNYKVKIGSQRLSVGTELPTDAKYRPAAKHKSHAPDSHVGVRVRTVTGDGNIIQN